MKRPARRTICKREGCTAPPHVYPSGVKASYCKAHLNTLTQKQRYGQPRMSGIMQTALTQLREAREAGYPFAELSVERRTVRALVDRDWIVASPGLDGVRYTITGRGLKALKRVEENVHRTDGVCPRCEQRPRGVYSTGRLKPYCDECTRLHGRRQYALKGYQLSEETPCSRCHKRPRMVFPSGKRIAYCAHCRKVMRKREKKRKTKRLLARIAIGEHVPCLKCDQPRYHTANTVYDYCREHYREYQNNYMRSRKLSETRKAA